MLSRGTAASQSHAAVALQRCFAAAHRLPPSFSFLAPAHAHTAGHCAQTPAAPSLPVSALTGGDGGTRTAAATSTATGLSDSARFVRADAPWSLEHARAEIALVESRANAWLDQRHSVSPSSSFSSSLLDDADDAASGFMPDAIDDPAAKETVEAGAHAAADGASSVIAPHASRARRAGEVRRLFSNAFRRCVRSGASAGVVHEVYQAYFRLCVSKV